MEHAPCVLRARGLAAREAAKPNPAANRKQNRAKPERKAVVPAKAPSMVALAMCMGKCCMTTTGVTSRTSDVRELREHVRPLATVRGDHHVV